MKRYFDVHDQCITASLIINDDSQLDAPADDLKKYFKSEDVREITLSQYRRVSEQYSK